MSNYFFAIAITCGVILICRKIYKDNQGKSKFRPCHHLPRNSNVFCHNSDTCVGSNSCNAYNLACEDYNKKQKSTQQGQTHKKASCSQIGESE